MDKRKQVEMQCKAVAHMATAIATVYGDYVTIFETGNADRLIDQVGKRTASFMETLGDMLNATDATDETDEWLTPVFEEAQRLWPSA